MIQRLELFFAALFSLFAIVGSAFIIYWRFFDTAPVLTRNETTTDKTEYRVGERVILSRDVDKKRDCAVENIVHRLVSQSMGLLPPLYTSRIRLVREGKHVFQISFRIPTELEEGTYRHRVSITYQCNPVFSTKPYVATSNTFQVVR